MLLQEPLCVTSYNSTGFGTGAQHFISTLSLFSNIICLQEHFLLDNKDKKYSNTNKLRKAFDKKYDMFIVPAHKENQQVNRGRGKGGLATLWDKSLTKYVSLVKCSNFRLQATKFEFPTGSLLLLNSYFPCDPRQVNFNETELLTLLADMKNILLQEKCIFNLILGDLNCHFLRGTRFTSIVENFFQDLHMKIFWENPDPSEGHLINQVDFTHCQIQQRQISTSVIDHFVGNNMVYNLIEEAGVFHSGENPSNHSPIFAKLKLNNIDFSTESIKSSKRVNWSKASEEAKQYYHNTVTEKLNSLTIPACVQCMDMQCKDHTEEIEEYTMNVLEAVETAAQESLPSTGGGTKTEKPEHLNVIPGWSEFVKPYCEESKFWHAVWASAGKPHHGSFYDTMIKSKRQYKHAVRRLSRANQSIQNDKFVQGVLGGGVDIFREIKKFRGKTNNCSSRIDDQVGSVNIANHFAGKYSDLYSSHMHGPEFVRMEENINDAVGQDCIADVSRITVEVVKKALKTMKAGKSDSIFDFQSDCLISGPEVLAVHLTNLLKVFVSHGSVPYFILICTLLPLVKDNLADITSSDNYRAIASGSLVLKLLDIVILILEGEKLECDQLQFGFQAKSSTSMCSWTATAVIEYFNRNKRTVYGCAMDLSKAFDLVEWVELFKILREKKVAPVFLRIMLFIYSNQ